MLLGPGLAWAESCSLLSGVTGFSTPPSTIFNGTTKYKYDFGSYVSGKCNGWTFNQAPLGTASKYSFADLEAYMQSRAVYIYGSTATAGTIRYCGVDNPTTPTRWYFVQQIDTTATPGKAQQGFSIGAHTSGTTCDVPSGPCGDGTGGRFYPNVLSDDSDIAASALSGLCIDACLAGTAKTQGPGINCDPGTHVCQFPVWVPLTGASCGTANPPSVTTPNTATPAPKSTGENCITSANGNTFCNGDADGENCGYVNGQYYCAGRTHDVECYITPGGHKVCGDHAPLPPAPDNGTRGVKATPNDVIKDKGPEGTTNTYNYYNSTTVGASSQNSTSGADPNTPGSTNPGTEPTPTTCVGTKCGDGTGSGQTGGASWCNAPPTCETAGSIECANLVQTWRTMCPQAVTEPEMRQGITDTGVGSDEKFPAGSAVAMTSSDFDATGFGLSRSCPLPSSINLGPIGTIAFDTGLPCSLLSVLGLFSVIAAYLYGAILAFGP